jgi:hypothetical protein
MKMMKTLSARKIFALVLAAALMFLAFGALAGCGEKKEETHTHTLEKVAGVPATCEEDGIAEHWICTDPDCGELFTDAEGLNETTLDALTIPALGHDYGLTAEPKEASYPVGAVLTAEDIAFTLTCSVCGDVVTIDSGVTVDGLDTPLIDGDNGFTAEYEYEGETFSCDFTVSASALDGIQVDLTDASAHFHTGDTIAKSDLDVIAVYENGSEIPVTGYTIDNPDLTAPETSVTVSYGGKSDTLTVTVTALQAVAEVAPTLDAAGVAAHYKCPDCGELFMDAAGKNPTDADALAIPALTLKAGLTDGTKSFYEGQKIDAADITVTVMRGSEVEQTVSAGSFTITDDILGTVPETTVEIGYSGHTATVTVPVKALTFVPEVTSTTTTPGTAAHYKCEDDGALFDAEMNPVDSLGDLELRLMQNINYADSAGTVDTNIKYVAVDGTSYSLTSEGGYKHLGGDTTINGAKMKTDLWIYFNFQVTEDAKVKLYLNTNTRLPVNKAGDVYSISLNGVNVPISDDVLMPGGSNGWLVWAYTPIAVLELKAGADNIVEVFRAGFQYDSSLDRSYHMLGVGVTPMDKDVTVTTAPVDSSSMHTPYTYQTDITGTKFAVVSAKNVFAPGVNVTDASGAAITTTSGNDSDNISAGASTVKFGAYDITYTINSDKATTAKLYIKTCAMMLENLVNDSYSFTVNDVAVTAAGDATMPYNDYNRWNTKAYTFVAEVTLEAGENTIVISRADFTDARFKDYQTYNFFGIGFTDIADGAVLSV